MCFYAGVHAYVCVHVRTCVHACVSVFVSMHAHVRIYAYVRACHLHNLVSAWPQDSVASSRRTSHVGHSKKRRQSVMYKRRDTPGEISPPHGSTAGSTS